MLVLAAGSALDASPAVLLTAAAAAGFDGVGLRLSHGRDPGAAALREVSAMAGDLGLVVHDVEVHRVGDGVDPRELIEACAAVGAGRLLAVCDLPSRSAAIEGFGSLASAAREAGIEVGVEYMAWTTPDGPIDAIAIARDAGCTVVADVLHHVRVGAGQAEMRRLVGSGVLGWVQLCDASAEAPADLLHEARHDRLPPGTGALPLDALLAVVPGGVVRSVEVQSDVLSAQIDVVARSRLLAAASAPWRSR
jgi:sugar phosphate isomerase/epimerase